jgi:hypothetical protein
MEIILVILFALNVVQFNEKGLRCKKVNNQEKGCSIFVEKSKQEQKK